MIRVLLLIIFILSGCTNIVEDEDYGQETESIISGKTTNHSRFPSIVAIFNGGVLPNCTGTFIRPNLVLTAAHCVKKYDISKLKILYGYDYARLDKEKNQNLKQVIVKAVHPYDDVALLYIEDIPENVTYAEILNPEVYKKVLDVNTIVEIAGYGMISDYEHNGYLNYGETVINQRGHSRISVGKCDNYKKVANVCFGDSGGPIYVMCENKQYVTGISNLLISTEERLCGNISIYILPGAFLEWINETYWFMCDLRKGECINYPIGEKKDIKCTKKKSNIDCGGCNIGGSKDIIWEILFALCIFYIINKTKRR